MKFKYTTQEEILKSANVKAFEYGHYTTQDERLKFLAASIASFGDMKKLTGFKTLGFNTFGIAFGARGMGGFAAAHFEPWSYMINLTRRSGYGCFAHEYGHAIDYFFGHYVEPSSKTRSLSGGFSVGLSPLKTPQVPGSLRDLMSKTLLACLTENGKASQSYNRLLKAHAGSQYWFRHTEIFARLFEQWISFKLNKKGLKNHFLTRTKYEDGSAYLTHEDFIRVLPLMDKLIKKMAVKSSAYCAK